MKIHSLYYKNLLQGWELEEVHFSDLNVLVGISGAGKTQIVNAIQNLAEIANGKILGEIEWKISFSIGKNEYIWDGKYVATNFDRYFSNKDIEIIIEKLIFNKKEIANQSKGIINYNGTNLPKIGNGESLLKLLSEPEIEAARKGFQTIIHKDYRNYSEDSMLYESFKKLVPKYETLSVIQNSSLPLIAKWGIVTRKFPEIYEQIKQDYVEIFPQVEDIGAGYLSSGLSDKEQMLEVWLMLSNPKLTIYQPQISSGMFRTLMAIVELYLCHEESLFLLDEFENSLGFNCLDKMFELIENKAYSGENQFILTTHNPYIIRNTDLAAIKIVTRKGNKIIVKNAIDMGLVESAQDNFFKIINLKEFREGVSA